MKKQKPIVNKDFSYLYTSKIQRSPYMQNLYEIYCLEKELCRRRSMYLEKLSDTNEEKRLD